MKPPAPGDAAIRAADRRGMSFEAFDALSSAYDGAVGTAAVPDRFCTRSDWIIPARAAFADSARPRIHRFDDGWAPLMRIDTVLGRTIVPFEYGWGFASPFVGADPGEVAGAFIDVAMADRGDWDALFLSGLVRGGRAFTTLVHRLRRRFQLRLGQPAVRRVASLAGGWDGFLSRRTGRFRKNLRRDARKAEGRYRIEVLSDVAPDEARQVYEAILEVEAQSWKGLQGVGIDDGPMRRFYARMVPRLAARGALRVTRAYVDDALVGYVLGGLAGTSYRGLQISFAESERSFGLGNLMQAETIAWLCAHEHLVDYDLGGDLEYKRRWAERSVETVPLLVR